MSGSEAVFTKPQSQGRAQLINSAVISCIFLGLTKAALASKGAFLDSANFITIVNKNEICKIYSASDNICDGFSMKEK